MMARFILFFCWISSIAPGQDSIFFKTGHIQPARIIRVYRTEVKYKIPLNMSGPFYFSGISELSHIKYRNGAVDSFWVYDPIDRKDPKYDQIFRSRDHYYFHQQRVDKPKILEIMRARAVLANNNELLKMVNLVDTYSRRKRRRFTLGLSVIGAGVITCAVASGLALGTVVYNPAYVYALVSGLAVVPLGNVFEVAAIISSNKRSRQFTKTITAYNASLP